jgi:hypothetical protein
MGQKIRTNSMKINLFSEVRTVSESKQKQGCILQVLWRAECDCNCTVVEICKQADTEEWVVQNMQYVL